MTARTARARTPRTLVHKLAAIVLGFEAIVVFLAGLTIFGLKSLPAGVEPWWAVVGGLVVALLMIGTAGMITRPGAIAFGWVLQAVVAASAVFVPAILLVALIFGGMWGYATIGGARLESRHSAGASRQPTDTHTESE